jgi:hypothetical protein
VGSRHGRRDLFRPIVSPRVLDSSRDPLGVRFRRVREARRRSYCYARIPELPAQVLVYDERLEVAGVHEQHEHVAAIIGASNINLGAQVLSAIVRERH